MLTAVFFWAFAIGAAASALLVVTRSNPVSSALSLVLCLFFVACLYAMMGAHFIAAVQVIVYAGAIVVLFLFVIMLLNLETEPRAAPGKAGAVRAALAIGGGVLFVCFAGAAARGAGSLASAEGGGLRPPVSIEDVGVILFTKYLFPFEIASLLLLVAIVGTVVLAKKRIQ